MLPPMGIGHNTRLSLSVLHALLTACQFFKHTQGKRHCFLYCIMNGNLPKVLILGHSFVKRLKHDLVAGFDPRAHDHFDVVNSARVFLYGVGGRKVSDVQSRDLHIIESFAPDILTTWITVDNSSKCRYNHKMYQRYFVPAGLHQQNFVSVS